MIGLLDSVFAPEPHGSKWRVIPLHVALENLQTRCEDLADLLAEIQNANLFKFWINDHWTNPVADIAGEIKLAAAVTMLDGNGRLQLLGADKNQPSDWVEFRGSLYDRFQLFADAETLEQKKKRQWGLFVKTKNRRPKHRGPKSDLLYLRVPHR